MEKEKFREDTILVEGKELYPIPGFSRYYCCLDEGKIFSTISEAWLSDTPNRNGYVYVSLLGDDGVRQHMGIHTAVVSANLGIHVDVIKGSGRSLTVDHIDNDKSNNSALNLTVVPFKMQFQNPITKNKLKNRSTKRMTQAEKDTLTAAWDSLEEPKRNEFVNEWNEKLDYDWRTIDNFVIKNLL